MNLTKEFIQEQLSRNAGNLQITDPFPDTYFAQPPREASVLVPLFQEAGEWKLLFIRRSEHENDRHSGQVAFPGGKQDDGDEDAIAAALRETDEEIGVSAGQIEILGQLNPYRTVSNFLVTPVISEITWPVTLDIDRTEVARVFSIPIPWLANPRNLVVRDRHLPDFQVKLPVYYYQRYDEELLWGVTAKITVSLLRSLGFSLPG